MELLIRNLLSLILDTGLLDAPPIESAVEKLEGGELERDADVHHVYCEGHLRHLRLLTLLP